MNDWGEPENITNWALLEAFIANPDNTFLITYGRSGSHWLRMLMELYFGQPGLVRAFFYPQRSNYTHYFTHDSRLLIQKHRNIIYLYRNPVDTIFSELMAFDHPPDKFTRDQVAEKTARYSRHIQKWLCDETFTTKKTVVSYDRLLADTEAEFAKVCHHFEENLDTEKFRQIAVYATKAETRNRGQPSDRKWLARDDKLYENHRSLFRDDYATEVWENLPGEIKDIFCEGAY